MKLYEHDHESILEHLRTNGWFAAADQLRQFFDESDDRSVRPGNEEQSDSSPIVR